MDKKTALVVLGMILIVVAFYFARTSATGIVGLALLIVGLLAVAAATLMAEEVPQKEEEPKPIVEVRKGPGVEEVLWLLPEKDRIIIGYLYKEKKAVNFKDLVEKTKIAKATLSRHIKTLEEEGKVKTEKDGNSLLVKLSKKARELLDKLA